jgi:chromate reductase, NAD(P)H dehydrogenase (quinone)
MITIISGTNRKNSTTFKIANLYQQRLKAKNVAATILDLAQLPPDFVFSALYEHNGKHEIFNQFRKQIADSQKLVFIVPEYNASFPGVLKAFIDGLQYPDAMQGKQAALVGLSAGVLGGAWALSHLTDILHYLNVDVISVKVRLATVKAHFVDGEITNPLYNELLDLQLAKLLA